MDTNTESSRLSKPLEILADEIIKEFPKFHLSHIDEKGRRGDRWGVVLIGVSDSLRGEFADYLRAGLPFGMLVYEDASEIDDAVLENYYQVNLDKCATPKV